MTSTWHAFRDTHDGDDQCGTCGVVVAAEAHLTFTLPCPVPDCPAGSNPDKGCVIVPGRSEVAACVYCHRPGSRDGDLPATDPELDAWLEDEDEDENF